MLIALWVICLKYWICEGYIQDKLITVIYSIIVHARLSEEVGAHELISG